MKKAVCILGLTALTAAAGTGQAATIYKDDKVSYSIKFDWQIQLRQDPGKDQDLDVEYDDLEFKNSVVYNLTDEWKAVGQLDYGFNSAADSSAENGDSIDPPHLEEAWLGLSYREWTAVAGKRYGASDYFGVEEAWEICVANDAFDAWGGIKGNDLIWVQGNDIGGIVYLEASYEMWPESEDSSENGTWADILVNLNLPAGIMVGGDYQNYDPDGDGDTDSFDIWGVQASWGIDMFTFGADYSEADEHGDVTNLVATVSPLKGLVFAAGYVIKGFDEEDEDDINGWYLNTSYTVQSVKNVTFIVELMDDDREDYDMGYMVGMRMKF